MPTIPVQAFQANRFRPALLHLEGSRCLGLEERRAGDAALYMSPGWIDSHAHVYPGATNLGIHPDRVGLSTGVHLVVDAGSAGCITFPCLRDYVLPTAKTQVRAFLNIGRAGLVTKQPYFDPRNLDVDGAVRCVEEDGGRLLLGVKVLSSGLVVEEAGLDPLRAAIRAGDRLGRPVMVHLAEGPPANEDTLPLLRRGDIISHIFHGAPNLAANQKAGTAPDQRFCSMANYLWRPDGSPIPALAEAMARGVLLDVGHGAASLDQEVARAAISAGARKFSISTDAHIRNVDTVVHSLSHIMSKFLAFGMIVEEVTASVTTIPARQLGLSGWAEEPLIRRATLFRLRPVSPADPPFLDAYRARIPAERVIEPVAAVSGGTLIPLREDWAEPI